MSIRSRLRNFERSLKGRELALLWLKSSQARGGYSEYWKTGEFQSWVSENEEAGLLYHLAFEVNGAVIIRAQGWRELASWASLLGISMIATTPDSKPFELGRARNLMELWREKLCAFLTEVVALEQAVGLISEGHFDGHDVLFADSSEALTLSYENAKLLIAGYNWFADENGKDPIDVEGIERGPGRKTDQLLNEWVMLSRRSALIARGKIFEAGDEVLSLLNTDEPLAD